jgi:3-oxoadipate enol-lactonase
MSHPRRFGKQPRSAKRPDTGAKVSSRVPRRAAQSPGLQGKNSEPTSSTEPTTKKHFVRSGRVPIAVDLCGDGEAVVFLHGMGGDRSNWLNQLEYFRKSHLAISIDSRGYGESGDYPGPFRYLDAARDVVAVLNALKIPEAHVVGLSMGGRIALKLYDMCPDRVRSLVLCSATARFAPTLSMKRRAEMVLEAQGPWKHARSRRVLAERIASRLCSPNAVLNARKTVAASLINLRVKNYLKAVASLLRFDQDSTLPKISIPTMVMAGEDDLNVTPEIATALARQIRTARLAFVKNAGHVTNLDQPDAFNRLLAKFLIERR